MAWRTIVIRNNAKLSYKMGYLLVRNETETFVFADEVLNLIIESNQTIVSTELLNQMVKRNVNIIFCDEKHLPTSQLVGLNNNFSTSKNILIQINWEVEIKGKLWKEIIVQKITNQRNILTKYGLYGEKILSKYIEEVEENDCTNREGLAAGAYFTSMFGKGFNRRDEENEINKVLNYLYSILLSIFSRCIVEYGYITHLGIWHHGDTNCFNLSSDFMEPFRPIVDDYILTKKIDKIENKQELQKILNTKLKINNRHEYFENAIKVYVKQCLNFLDKNVTYIYQIEGYEF